MKTFLKSLILIFIMGGIIAFLMWCYKDTEEQQKLDLANWESKEVMSCVLTSNTNFSFSGTFILGTGGFSGLKSIDVKYYLYIMQDKGFVLTELDADKVQIVPTNEITPHIEGHFNEYGEIYQYIDSTNSDYVYQMTHYILYLPKDYITQEYNFSIKEELKQQ